MDDRRKTKVQLIDDLTALRQRVLELENRSGFPIPDRGTVMDAQTRAAKLTERLNLATRSAGIGIWDWNIQQNQLIWDDQMYALYGLRPGQFGGAYEA